MGIRYRKRIKIFPGLHMNLSKSGISFNLGKKGANVTIGSNGLYSNFGIPGSGLSYRSKFSGRSSTINRQSSYNNTNSYGCITKSIVFVLLLILVLTCLAFLRDMISYHEKGDMTQSFISFAISILLAIGIYFIFKKIFKKEEIQIEYNDTSNNTSSKPYIPPSVIIDNNIRKAEEALKKESNSLKREILTWYIEYEKDHVGSLRKTMPYLARLSPEIKEAYKILCSSYMNITGGIWHITDIQLETTINNRNIFTFKGEKISLTNKDFMGIHIEPCTPVFQTSHSKIYLFPTVVIEETDKLSFNIIPYKELDFKLTYILNTHNFLGCKGKLVGNSWKHTNMDGSKDSRFKNNPIINIYQYGCLKIGNYSYIFGEYDEMKKINKNISDLSWVINKNI